jgi:deoxycytidylate deaminase
MLPSTSHPEIVRNVCELMEKDAVEEDNDFGQRLRETFHVGDVFIDGLSKQKMDEQLDRFVQAFFGRTDIAPTKQEYGMYAAKSASLRSSDLSRQVGAAIFTDDGELVTQGCNEVPKAMGGTYWDSEDPDFRDVKLGHDPNDVLKTRSRPE